MANPDKGIACTALVAVLLLAAGAPALTPAERCQASKLKTAGKYGFCRLKAESKSVKTGNAPDFSKCDEKFSLKWGQAESIAGTGVCPSEGDEAAVQAFITQHSGDVAAAVADGPLPDCPGAERLKTGQTTCYDASGTVIACAGTGQDGELQKGLSRSYTDNGDGTITDNRTGLTWEKLSDDGSIHDKENFYTWTDAFAIKVATLNSGSFAGFTDWRVPNVNEMQSLVDYSISFPATDAVFDTGCVAGCTVTTCSCTGGSLGYWSSTSMAGTPSFAWYVPFLPGGVNYAAKSDNQLVRAVRGGS